MPRERAIVLSPRAPWPQDDGGRIGLWQTVWAAAQEWSVVLIALVPPEEMEAPIPPELSALGVEVVLVPHRPPPMWRAAIAGTFGRWPYTITRFQSAGLRARLREIVARDQPRFVFVNHLALAIHAASAFPAAVVLREHNVETLWLERFARTRRNPLVRAFALAQSRRMRKAERALCEAVDLVLAIHPEEVELLRHLAPQARIELLPMALDSVRFTPSHPADPPIVLLLGTWSWIPNAEGLVRFLEGGMAALRETAPGARVRVVGKGLGEELAEKARVAGAEPVGYVADVGDELRAATLLLVPLWSGAGVRIKIVEAMAAGVPVVATTMAAEGLALADGREILLGETPAELARAAGELLHDPARARAIGRAARERALAEYDAPRVAALMNRLCAEVSARRGT